MVVPFNVRLNLLFEPITALALLEWLTVHNERVLAQHPEIPPLYASGVRYASERREVWSDAYTAWRKGSEDCDSLCTWRAAELRRQGVDALPMLIEAPGGGYHCLVRIYDRDGIEHRDDPSLRLGMRVPNLSAYRRNVLLES